MKVYELMEMLANMEAGVDAFVCGESWESECLELQTVTKDGGDWGVTLWANGTTHGGKEAS